MCAHCRQEVREDDPNFQHPKKVHIFARYNRTQIREQIYSKLDQWSRKSFLLYFYEVLSQVKIGDE